MKTNTMPAEEHYAVRVRQFHRAFGCAAPEEPGPCDEQTRYARLQLGTEEGSELLHALAAGDLIEVLDAMADSEYVVCGCIVAYGVDRLGYDMPHYGSQAEWGVPRIPGADLMLQMCAGLFGSMSALGMALAGNDWRQVGEIAGGQLILLGKLWEVLRVDEDLRQLILDEVHRSNMSKFGADGMPVVNEAGRVVKGPNYSPPDILGVVRRYLGQPEWTPPPLRTAVSTPLSGGVR